jgi:sec-independent protein translocase protein TatB
MVGADGEHGGRRRSPLIVGPRARKTRPSIRLDIVFNIGPEKLILLLVIALIVLGPTKLPDAARTLGRVVGELRRMSGNFQAEVREALNDPKDALTAAVADVRQELSGVHQDLSGMRQELGGFGLGGSVGSPPSTPAPGTSPPSATPIPPSPDDPSLN